ILRDSESWTCRARDMTDIFAHFTTFAAEFAAALPRKIYDPVAWGAFVGALLIVIGSNLMPTRDSNRRAWVNIAATCILIVAIQTLEARYLSAPVPRGNSAALAFIYLLGVLAGGGLLLCFRRRSAPRP